MYELGQTIVPGLLSRYSTSTGVRKMGSNTCLLQKDVLLMSSDSNINRTHKIFLSILVFGL